MTSSRKTIQHRDAGSKPSPQEIDSLVALFKQGRYAEIETLARAMTARFPLHGFGWKAMGTVLLQQGRTTEALVPLQKAAELSQGDAQLHNNLGNAFAKKDRLPEAEASYRQALKLNSGFVEAHHNLGNTLLKLGQLSEAEASYRRALALNPNFAEAHNNLGSALLKLDRLSEAEASYRRALGLKPDYAEAHCNLGDALKNLGQLDGAIASYRRALEINPTYAITHYNLGNALKNLGQLDVAAASYRNALEIKPDYFEAHFNLGNALHGLNQPDDAELSYRRALEINPDSAEAHNNLGNALKNQGLLDAAANSYRKALSLKPDYADAHHHLSLTLLLHGKLQEGWLEHEWRIKCTHGNSYIADPRNLSRILPRPSTLLPLDLNDKRILFTPEQGIGDEIFFLRFARTIQQRGAWTAYLSAAKIATIVQRAPGLNMVISGEAISSSQGQIMSLNDIALPSNLDHIFSVGDLPLILGANRLDDIPPPLPLTVLPDRVSAIKDRLSVLGGAPLLGVTWRAGTESKLQTRALCFRETNIPLLGGVLSKWPGEVLILQRNPRPDEIESFARALGRPAHDWSELNESLEDMLALLSQLDEYVGVHNTNMHLMAGLGKSARVLITYPPEWRDMLEDDESPWFPGFQLYREKPDGDWSAAFSRLTEDLRKGRTQ